MADTKVSALTAATSASADDLLYLVDDPAGTPTSKKITFANVQASISALGATQIADGSVSNTEFQYIGTLTSDAQTQLNAKQPLDSTLTALAAYNTNGLITQTGADTFTGRTLTGPAAGISVSNGNGVSGNPTLALANDLAAVEGLASNGLAARTASDTWAVRTITGTANNVTVTNGDGVSGNPTISLDTRILTQTLPFILYDGGSVISTGLKASIEIPFSCTINQVTLLADQSGSIVVDLKKSTYASWPTTSSIVASAPPTLSSAQKSQDSTLTGWTTSITAGDILEYIVTSATTVTRVTVNLRVSK